MGTSFSDVTERLAMCVTLAAMKHARTVGWGLGAGVADSNIHDTQTSRTTIRLTGRKRRMFITPSMRLFRKLSRYFALFSTLWAAVGHYIYIIDPAALSIACVVGISTFPRLLLFWGSGTKVQASLVPTVDQRPCNGGSHVRGRWWSSLWRSRLKHVHCYVWYLSKGRVGSGTLRSLCKLTAEVRTRCGGLMCHILKLYRASAAQVHAYPNVREEVCNEDQTEADASPMQTFW